MKIGVVALQGGFALHEARLRELGAGTVQVRSPAALSDLDGLVLPGGESTTLLRLLDEDFCTALIDTGRSGLPILATCAGLILLARRVEGPAQRSLDLLDITVMRNGYGRQLDSFVEPHLLWTGEGLRLMQSLSRQPPPALEGVFIRAPRITNVGLGTEVLLRRGNEAVLVRSGNILGATFHPELASGGPVIHQLFLAGVGLRCSCSCSCS